MKKAVRCGRADRAEWRKGEAVVPQWPCHPAVGGLGCSDPEADMGLPLLGPTGVGNRGMARDLAEYVDDEEAMLRIRHVRV